MKRLILIIGFILSLGHTALAITAHVQTVSGDWVTGSTMTAVLIATNGNCLAASVHLIANNSSNSITGVADGTNGAYTQLDLIQGVDAGDNVALGTFYIKNITGGALTVTATLNSSVIDRARLIVEEVSGCDTTAPLDQNVANAQTAVATTADAITSTAKTAAAGDFIYAASVLFFSGSAVITNGTGFTNTAVANTSQYASEYIANFAGGSKAGTFTTDTSLDTWTAVVMFKAAAGGGGSTPKNLPTLGVGQ